MAITIKNNSAHQLASTDKLIDMVKNDLPQNYKELHFYDNNDILLINALDDKQELKAIFVLTYQTYPHLSPKSLLKVVNRKRRFTYFHNGQAGINIKVVKWYDTDDFEI